MKFVSIYITARDAREARKIASFLLKEGLIVCANIISKTESMYWWKGKLQRHGEALIIAKGMEKNGNKIIGRVKELHSYDVPCVVFWPIIDGNKDYLKWILLSSVKKEAKKPL